MDNLDLSFNYLHPARTSPLEPQNLLRVTNKGCTSCSKGTGLLNNGVVRMATRPLAGLGTSPTDETEADVDEYGLPVRRLSGFTIAMIAISTVSAVVSAYHGYKRNDSIGWAIVWYFMGAWFPIITPTVALAQGYGKPYRKGGIKGFNGKMKRALRRAKRRR